VNEVSMIEITDSPDKTEWSEYVCDIRTNIYSKRRKWQIKELTRLQSPVATKMMLSRVLWMDD